MRMRFSNEKTQNVFEGKVTFEAFSELMNDRANGREIYDAEGKAVAADKADAKIREVMFEILGVDEKASKKEIRRAINRHKIDVYEVTEDIVENMLKTGWGENPFFKEFVEIKNGEDGETNEFYAEDNVILTISELSNGHHNLFRQRLGEGSAYSVKVSNYGAKIYAEYERFMTGAIDWAKFVQKIYEAYDKKVNELVYAALMSAGSKLPAQSQFNVTGAISASTKDQFIELVQDVEAANGTKAVIMGTHAALSKLTALTPAEWISEDMKVQRNTTGRVADWEGVKLVEIPVVFADNDLTRKLTDNTKLLVMPVADNKFIKIFNEGDNQVREISDGNTNMDMTIEYEFQKKMGVGVVIGRQFGVWTIA